MNEGFQDTTFAQVLEGAARDEARKRMTSQHPEDGKRQQLARYVRQVARTGGYEALLSKVMGRVYHLSAHQWELLGEGLREGSFTVGRGGGWAVADMDTKGLVRLIRARRYGLTEEGLRVAKGERA